MYSKAARKVKENVIKPILEVMDEELHFYIHKNPNPVRTFLIKIHFNYKWRWYVDLNRLKIILRINATILHLKLTLQNPLMERLTYQSDGSFICIKLII